MGFPRGSIIALKNPADITHVIVVMTAVISNFEIRSGSIFEYLITPALVNLVIVGMFSILTDLIIFLFGDSSF